MKIIDTNNAPAAIGPYSQAIAIGDLIYTSGQIPINPISGEIDAAKEMCRSLRTSKRITRGN